MTKLRNMTMPIPETRERRSPSAAALVITIVLGASVAFAVSLLSADGVDFRLRQAALKPAEAAPAIRLGEWPVRLVGGQQATRAKSRLPR